MRGTQCRLRASSSLARLAVVAVLSTIFPPLGVADDSSTTTTTTGGFTPGPFDFAVFATARGCSAIKISGNATIDSFDSSAGTYTQTKQLSKGLIGVDGNIDLTGNATVYGSVFALNTTVGKCQNGVPGITLSGKAAATGGYIQLSAPPTFVGVPVIAASTTDLKITANMVLPPGNYGNITVSGHSTLTVSPGTYNINSISVTGQSVVTVSPPGRVIINVAGNNIAQPIQFSGGEIDNPTGIPSNFQLIYGGTSPIALSGGSNSHAILYAPNAPVSIHGGSDWFGAMVVGTLDDSGGVEIHYDRSLAVPPTITALVSPAPNGAGWNNANTTVTFTCSDPVFGIASCSPPVQITTEGANQSVTGTAVNRAGFSATISVTVNLDKTPPIITSARNPPPNAAGWNNSNVTVSFACSDALSGIASCSTPVTVSSDGAGQVITGTAVDKAGNTANAVSIINLDKTPPTITATITPLPNAAGWNNSNVTVTFTCSDPLSGVDTCPAAVQVTREGANQIISGTARDKAGNTASISVTVNLDKTAPTIVASASPVPNAAGWNNTNVTVTFTCSDSGSGIDVCPTPVQVTTDGGSQVISGTAKDKAGNTATASTTVNLDKTPPVLTITSPVNGAVVPLPSVTVTGNVNDLLSGVASVTCQGNAATISSSTFTCVVPVVAGPNTITVQATDAAGNGQQASVTVQGGVPIILSATPNSGQQGQMNESVAIAGKFTHFVQGTSQVSFGAGITVGAVTVATATSLTADISIALNAMLGPRPVMVTTGTEVDTLAGGFNVTAAVNQPPVVSAGANQTITLPSAQVQFTEYPVPTAGSGPREITAGPDGNLWFTDAGNNIPKIRRITPAGVITEFPVQADEGITVGPDGNLWFTKYGGQKIGRITTAGVITEFLLPNGGSYPFGITAGPDGNLWFAERYGNNIGRITPAGLVTEFPIPTAGSQPFGITVGPDGNLWFTEGAAHQVGRITTAGAFMEFPLPTTGPGVSDPFWITSGPDGNLWFTEANNNKIGRITPTGVITEFPVPTSNSAPREITAGSDGNLWFTDESANNNIGRITTAGVITEFPAPTPGSVPQGITAGPDGNLWFTEENANKIGVANYGVFSNLPATITLTGSVTDDGLPAGATLSTTWSETSGPSPVSFGTPTATFPDVAGQTNPVTTSAIFSAPGTYTLGLTASDSLLNGNASVTITVNPPQVPTLLSVSPSTGSQGQQNLSVNITGQFTHFVQGTTIASFGSGITVTSLTVNSATSATVVLSIAPSATPGPRRVTLSTGTEMATLGNAFTVNTPVCLVPPTGLVAWWPGDGNANDIIGGDNGTPVGGVAFTAGEVGQAFNLNGVDGYVQAADSPSLNLQSMTVETWVYPNPTGNYGLLVTKYDSQGGRPYGRNWAFEALAASAPFERGKLSFIVYSGVQGDPARGIETANVVLTTGQWQHVAATFDLTTQAIKIFVNGTEVPTNFVYNNPITAVNHSSVPILIGSIVDVFGVHQYFDGAIDEVSVYNRALAASEIQAIFNAGSAGKCKGETGVPAIILVAPNTGQQGQQNGSVVITGQFTHFVQGTSQVSFGAGITVGAVTVTSATSLKASITLALNAALGPRTVMVTTGAEVVSLSSGFTVTAAVNQPPIVSAGPNQTITLQPAPVTFTEFLVPTASTGPRSIAAGPDGNLWFTEDGGTSVGRVTPAGVITEFLVPSRTGTEGITAGPDGNLWFTEYSGQKIGRITPAGIITEFPLAGGAYPFGVTAGPDGNVWFVERLGNKIGRITPAGVISEFSIPSPNSNAEFITTGPDGNLWFTEMLAENTSSFGNGKIGRITPTGVITEFSILTTQGAPEGIVAGPDGNLWFAEGGGNNIGRITPVGVITEFPIPTANSGPFLITVGPDGNMWFTESSKNNIGRITPAGVITEFPIPTANVPEGITVGPDCNLWFTDGGGNKIGKAIPGVVLPVTTTLVGSILDDGLPLGATLTAAWSALSGPAPVSLGNPTAAFPDVDGQTNPVVTSATFCRVGQYTLNLTGSDSQLNSSSSTTITVNLPQTPAIIFVNPNTGQQGQSNLPVSITGDNTHFAQGTTAASFGPGITVVSLTVISPATATAVLNIDLAAVAGPRNVSLTTGTEVAYLPGGFTVTAAVNQPPVVSAGSNQTITLPAAQIQFMEYPVPTPGAIPEEITTGPDGNLWFEETNSNKIGRINTAGLIVEFAVPTSGSVPGDVTTGPDGNLWFTEYLGNNIGRITTAGVFTEFSVPTAGSHPFGITAGPDGNLWFAERFANQIGKITPVGVITEIPLPTTGSQPMFITTGTDGNLWFTESVGNKIGRITTAGAITEFPLPTSASEPSAITTGPDGNLWFTEASGNRIGKITPAGVITESSIATGNSQPRGITVGPDGNLWFAENATDKIGRITTAGVITEFPTGLTAGSGPVEIITGPDGNLWFTVGVGNGIIKANLGVFPTPWTATLTGSMTDDGLPVGATLTTTWSETSGPSPVSFGTPTATFPDVAGQANPVTTSATFSTPGTFTLGLTASDSLLNGNASVTITVNPPQVPTLLSVSPNTGSQGQQNLLVNITGQFTHFVQGTTTASFGAGITVASLTVNSATTATAVLNIDPAAVVDPRRVTVTIGTEMATLGNGFTVLSGTNQPPIVSAGPNQTITIQSAPVSITEYPIPTPSSNSAESIAIGPDGNLWFPEHDANKIGRITPAGMITEFPVPSVSGSLQDIAAGPDGNLWFTDYFGQKVWRITTTGVTTGFDSRGYPYGITPGPDGNLWFTQRIGNNIARITTGGVITEFPIPTASSQPFEITTGPDGNLWFTEGGAANGMFLPGNKIGRITTAGVITEFPVPTANSQPYGITTGSDGNLWFTEGFGNNIGRITPAGVITEFPIPSSSNACGPPSLSTCPAVITAGPDGNMWFTEQFGNNIGSITPAGVITEFPVPTNLSRPYGIIAGPDCNLWFTEIIANKIGKANFPYAPGIASLTGNVMDDGLPVGSTLTTAWSRISGGCRVSFSNPTATFPDVAGQANPVVTSATFSVPGTYNLRLTGSDSVLSSSSSVTITVNPPSGPSITNVVPNSGQQGQQNLSVTINGQLTHFVQGTTIASFGAGITLASLTVNSSTTASAVLNIDAAATVGPRTVTFTTGTEVASLPNGFLVAAVTTGPSITTVSPNSGQQGQGGPVGIVGLNTHFVQGTTQVDFGAGITVSNINVTCPTCLTAQLQIAAGALPGPRTVTVTTGTEVASLANGFTIQPGTPIVTSFAPTSGQQGQTFTLTVTGQFTHFTQGTTQVSLGAGITVSNVSVSSTMNLTAQVVIDPAAAVGTKTLTVTTGTEVVSVANVFNVLAATPIIFSLNPGGGQQGQQNLSVAVTGISTHFVQGTTTASFGAGITVVSLTVNSPTSATAVVNIDPAAVLGARTVTLTTNAETASFTNGFTVSAATPIVLSLNPGGGQQGQQNLSVAITGLSTHWVQGTTTASFGAGVTVVSLTVTSTTAATAVLNIDPAAAVGTRTVTVMTGAEVASFVNGFTISAGTPVIATVNPNTGQQGQQNLSANITGQFTHFVQGTTAATFGAGIAVVSLTVNSPTSATAVININSSAPVSSRDVTLTTGSEIATLLSGFNVTSSTPAVTQVSPNTGPQGQQNLQITITGQSTHLVQGTTTANFGAGITVASLTVNSATMATVVLNIDPAATPGPRNVTLTTGSEAAALNNGFTITNGAPVITQISPNMSPQGIQNLSVQITGQFTHFAQGTTQVSFGTGGVTVNSVSVTNAGLLTANISIALNQTAGSLTVTVTTGAEIVSLPSGFLVQPAVNQPPVITIAPTWIDTLPNLLTITYDVADDGLPVGGALTVSWQTVSGPGNVGFQNQTLTCISCPPPGIPGPVNTTGSISVSLTSPEPTSSKSAPRTPSSRPRKMSR